jgi:hypothetical protein
MTVSIVAPPAADVDLLPLVPRLPVMPPLPVLRELAAHAYSDTLPVPLDEPAGPIDVQLVLDDLVPPIEEWRRVLRDLPAAGFLVTAADVQRAAEVLRLLDQASRILAERA